MIEVKSPTDSVEELISKIADFLSMGTQVAVLIDPETQTVTVYRVGQSAVVLRNGDVLTVPDMLPGWEVLIEELWPPVFE